MEPEPLAEKLYWLQQQIDGGVIFIVLATCFVILKLIATRNSQKSTLSISIALTISALMTFLPLGAMAIGELDLLPDPHNLLIYI